MWAHFTSLAQMTSSVFLLVSVLDETPYYQELQFKPSLQCFEVHDVLKTNHVLFPGINVYSNTLNMSWLILKCVLILCCLFLLSSFLWFINYLTWPDPSKWYYKPLKLLSCHSAQSLYSFHSSLHPDNMSSPPATELLSFCVLLPKQDMMILSYLRPLENYRHGRLVALVLLKNSLWIFSALLFPFILIQTPCPTCPKLEYNC